jgi:RimJ/RimL family protein N-acetyltransferase
MTILINPQLSLSPLREGDEDAMVRWLNDPVLQRNTLRIPSPYRLEHAREFIDYVGAMRAEHGRATEWAIRDGSGALIGGIGFSRVYGKYSHKDEMGYWLAEPYRGRGIMTQVVAKVCEVGLGPYKLLRIEAPVFTFNAASARVLEKNGFVAEGILRSYFLKNDKPVDVKMYAKIKPNG